MSARTMLPVPGQRSGESKKCVALDKQQRHGGKAGLSALSLLEPQLTQQLASTVLPFQLLAA